jgi:hypothetical protein
VLEAAEAYRAQRRAAQVTPLNTDKTRTARRAPVGKGLILKGQDTASRFSNRV